MAMHIELLLLLLLLLSVLLILIGIGKKQERKHELKLPPSPPRLPIIGNLHHLRKHPHRTLCDFSTRYGPLMHLQLGRVPTVVISSAQVAEEALKTHDLKFFSRPAQVCTKRLSYNFSDISFSPYNATWRELRKISMLKLFNPRMVESFQPMREEEVERMVRLISSLASPLEPINLSILLHSLSSNIICRVAFGKRSHNEGRGEQKDIFHKILLEAEALFMEFFWGDYFPWVGWIDVLCGLQARLEKNFRELEAFYQEVIEAHLDPTRPTEREEDFVDMLLRLQKEETHLTENHVKGVLMNIFIAGTDTSSATLEYAMAELMRNPSTMLKAQAKVRKMVGNKGKVDEGDLSRLSYIKLVVKETLRLHLAAPLLVPRETLGQVNINGYDILPKTRVIVNAWAIGRDPDSCENPEEFIPERFMDTLLGIYDMSAAYNRRQILKNR